MSSDLVIVLIVGLIIVLRGYRMILQHRQLKLLLEERKLLIEKGSTDLTPLEIPEMPTKKAFPWFLAAGIILLFVSPVFLVGHLGYAPTGPSPESAFLWLCLMSGAIGLALLVIHFIAEAYERRERQEEQEPPG